MDAYVNFSSFVSTLREHSLFFSWCFWIMALEKTLWTAKRLNQSILKKINPEYSLEVLLLKLMFQYFGCLMWRVSSLEKTLMPGKIEGKRRSKQQRMRWLDCITDSTDVNLSKLWETVEGWGACHTTVHGVTKSWTWFSDWTITITVFKILKCQPSRSEHRP